MNSTNNSKGSISFGGVDFSHDDLFTVVDAFYNQVAVDPILKEPFKSVHDWPEHIERLTHFWWIRLGGEPYMFTHYNPIAKHYHAGFNRHFLTRWLELFHQVIDEKLNQEQAQVWKNLSQHMGEFLFKKNELFKTNEERQS